jgi:hypothetical protein
MELALKAWFVFDHDDPRVLKSHNLIKLFDRLKPESQEKLDAEFKRSVVPYYPNCFYIDYSIRHILYQHQDAFTDWRYLHEAKKSMMLDQGAFEATLEMVLRERLDGNAPNVGRSGSSCHCLKADVVDGEVRFRTCARIGHSPWATNVRHQAGAPWPLPVACIRPVRSELPLDHRGAPSLARDRPR